jgi:hypothetical protein
MPGVNFENDDEDFDGQELAETFDESMTVGSEDDDLLAEDGYRGFGEDRRTFEELPDVYDVTSRAGDRDQDEELALDADEFNPEAFDDEDAEDDNELDYAAADAEREDELDGLGAEAGADAVEEATALTSEIEGLDEIRDRDEVTGGEDDFSNFSARNVGDEDLKRMGYSEIRDGEARAKPDGS